MSNSIVMFWNEKAASILDLHSNPGDDARRFAVIQIAIHDALNTILPKYMRLAFHDVVNPDASADAAVTGAAYKALEWAITDIEGYNLKLIAEKLKPLAFNADDSRGKILSWYNETMDSIPDGLDKLNGMMLGVKAAEAIIANRALDRRMEVNLLSDKPDGPNPGDFRADYYLQPAPPKNKFLVNFGIVNPFVIDAGDAYPFRQDPNYKDPFKRNKDLEEVKLKGGVNSDMDRRKRETVDFWSNLKQHIIWNNFAAEIIKKNVLNAWETARVFALIHTAMADGAIAMFKDVYHFYQWRPVTAINYGRDITDLNNPWIPYKGTPRVPEYPSTFGILGGAAGEILKEIFTNNIGQIYLKRDILSTISYDKISEAVEANALTKIECGWNLRKTAEDSLKQGRQIGKYVIDNAFKKNKLFSKLTEPPKAGQIKSSEKTNDKANQILKEVSRKF